ncbi:MAG: response regulator [Deltaproteobacteria bacterium]|nr:response regulator [Deltaproteobacteria bacterium]
MILKRFDPSSRATAIKKSDESSMQHVLYVEDEDVNWEVAEHGLRSRYRMTRARDARETFELVQANRFELILMDIQLSGSDLDGIAITRALRGTLGAATPSYATGVIMKDTPIVFVTAYTARYRREELVAAGGSDLITKPVNLTGLSLAISRWLSRGAIDRLSKAK